MPESLGETAQAELGGGSGIVVPFKPELAEQFPSIRLLLPGDLLFEALVREAAPEEVYNVQFVCGQRGGNGSSVTRSSRVAEAKQAAVVEPAVTSESVKNLLGGTNPISDTDDAEQTVLSWLSQLPTAD